ncbi:MAG: GNAT family N-acetyltransferase [Alistipes sp.]|nr:GNAT family N-acetyltransferase [Alistipes sp.]
MDVQRILSIDDPLFRSFWELYCDSFPRSERRSESFQAAALRSPHYRLELFFEGAQRVGLLGYWTLSTTLYFEHLAVDPSLRGGGYGQRIMRRALGHATLPVVLEVEPVVDELTERRIHFYDRLGFALNPFLHPQPLYHRDETEPLTLLILSSPRRLTLNEYREFDHDLRTIAMKREE